ncbi:MAG: hypothetical protein JXA00_05935 [Candidatus Thermoplasmatota archaeon]|nr:hypothetical protein [Candidatus Thermoplasmatota archaeon]
MRHLWSNEQARIPFTVIGVFLLISSSITTVYISTLEYQNAEELALGLGGRELQSALWYAEADLARCLNYAACTAFEDVGSNPVVEVSSSLFSIDADGDHIVTTRDVNLNIARFITAHLFTTMIMENYYNERYTQGRYSINVTSLPVTWQNITLQKIIGMTMNRAFNHPFLPAGRSSSSYPVYPVLSVPLTLQVNDLSTHQEVLHKTVVISTVITTRFLLLENLTDEFDARLDGSFGSLGISALVGTLGLTWLRGYAQFAYNKPVNIISTDWLALLTNGAILAEEGFVFNSVDALGVVYVGYETAKTIAKEFGASLNEPQELDYQTLHPLSSTEELQSRYTDDAQRLANESVDVDTSFSLQVNISTICEEECRRLIADTDNTGTLSERISAVYSATAEVLTDRTLVSDNWAAVQTQYQQQKDASIATERILTEDDAWAHAHLVFPPGEGWSITAVEWHSGVINGASSTSDPQYMKSRFLTDTIPFNNTQLSQVVLGGEQWDCERDTNISCTWLVRTTWRITAQRWNTQTNTTEVQTTSVSFESFPYNHHAVHRIIDTVLFEFISRMYTHAAGTHDDLLNAFSYTVFEGKDDPNLATVYNPEFTGGQQPTLTYYQSTLGFDDDFRTTLLLTYDTDYGPPLYSDAHQIPAADDHASRLYPLWIHNTTFHALESWRKSISASLATNTTVDPTTMPDELLRQVVNETLTLFTTKRTSWDQELSTQYATGSLYHSAAAKVVYTTIQTYLSSVEDRLDDIQLSSQHVVEDSTDEAMQDSGVQLSSYSDIKQMTMQAHGLQVALPLAATITLEHPGADVGHWTEPVSFALLQKPSFFSNHTFHDYHDETGEQYYLKYRNINIFSPGAGLTNFISQGFDALNRQVLSGIDQGFARLQEISNTTIRLKLAEALDTIAAELTNAVSTRLADAIRDAQGSGSYLTDMDLITPDEVKALVNDIVQTYTSDPQTFIHQLNSSALRDDIIAVLQAEVQQRVVAMYGELQEILQAAGEAVKSQVLSVYDTVVSQAIEHSRSLLKEEYNELSAMLEQQIGDEVSSLVGMLIPSGLPLLPPFGWWCTLNVWYIEVAGQIPFFTVVDTQDETLAHPFWGHTAQAYSRTRGARYVDLNNDGDLSAEELIGKNHPVDFSYATGSFIVVPPGKTGVGDRSGGWDELDETGVP